MPEPEGYMSGLPHVVCPACHTQMGLEAMLGTDDARGVVEALASMPGPPLLRKSVLRYVGLFAPASQKLRWDRAERLLREVAEMMAVARIERGGRVWPAPIDYWQQAFDAIFTMATLRRPLKSHGLLLEIIAGLAAKAEAGAETKREAARAGHTPVGGLPSKTPEKQEAETPRASKETIAAALAGAKSIVGCAK